MVSTGDFDNFLLNHAVHLLDDEMKKVEAQFVFKYYPADHFTFSTEYSNIGYRFLAEKYREWLASTSYQEND